MVLACLVVIIGLIRSCFCLFMVCFTCCFSHHVVVFTLCNIKLRWRHEVLWRHKYCDVMKCCDVTVAMTTLQSVAEDILLWPHVCIPDEGFMAENLNIIYILLHQNRLILFILFNLVWETFYIFTFTKTLPFWPF